jgi:hypothetical protein
VQPVPEFYIFAPPAAEVLVEPAYLPEISRPDGAVPGPEEHPGHRPAGEVEVAADERGVAYVLELRIVFVPRHDRLGIPISQRLAHPLDRRFGVVAVTHAQDGQARRAAVGGQVIGHEVPAYHGAGIKEHQERRRCLPGAPVARGRGSKAQVLLEVIANGKLMRERLRDGFRVIR